MVLQKWKSKRRQSPRLGLTDYANVFEFHINKFKQYIYEKNIFVSCVDWRIHFQKKSPYT